MKTVLALVVYPCINRQQFEVTRSATKFYGDADFEHKKYLLVPYSILWGVFRKNTFLDDDFDIQRNF